MKFCILIELSKEHISFLYNRDDSDNGFVPFVEQGPLPLAIYCSGNQMEVGQFAIDEANKQNPNAYTDVFSKLRDGGTFRYRGEEIPNNMLLFNAIQRYLTSFFDSTLIGQMGRLEQNVATMPICFLFHADINENERLFVKDSFLKSGFANVGLRDCDQLAMNTMRAESENYVCVTSNGQDLFVNIYNRKRKRIETLFIRNKGRDPRMDVAIEKLWDSIGYDNYYLNREQEQPILEQVAENFLGTGDYSFNESVTLSNGSPYNMTLSLHELEQFSLQDDGKTIIDVMRKLADNNISTKDCTVILQGKAAHNSFFSKMFRTEFPMVKSIDSIYRTEMLATLLEEVQVSNYQFAINKGETPSPHITTSEPHTTPKPTAIPVQTDSQHTTAPTKRDERDLKMLSLEVETYITTNRTELALKEIEIFAGRMHDKGVAAFDNRIKTLIADVKKASNQSEHSETTVATEPTGRDKRDLKMLQMEIATYIKNGEKGKIRQAVIEFRKKMHAKNIHAFDEELAALESASKGKSAGTTGNRESRSDKSQSENVSCTEKEVTFSENEGMKLMQNGMFKEAREWFRNNNQRLKADDCTTIIRWLRFLSAYESELQATITAKNREKARVRIKEINEIVSLYNKYDIDTSRLVKLSNEYKRIK